ncbi:MAG TPA: acyl-CoA carboxylase subunit epsilon [Pseudonocardiaceae bacterium]|nr:acyl-CoA carboxylase subunit epsilon [Pseudonocardiaceae bacterium]
MNEPRTSSPAPAIQILRGEPSEEELAALIAVFAVSVRPAAADPSTPRSSWGDPAHRLSSIPPFRSMRTTVTM